jgi:hypothetical protein
LIVGYSFDSGERAAPQASHTPPWAQLASIDGAPFSVQTIPEYWFALLCVRVTVDEHGLPRRVLLWQCPSSPLGLARAPLAAAAASASAARAAATAALLRARGTQSVGEEGACGGGQLPCCHCQSLLVSSSRSAPLFPLTPMAHLTQSLRISSFAPLNVW